MLRHAAQFFGACVGHGVGRVRHDHHRLVHGQPGGLPGAGPAADPAQRHQRRQGEPPAAGVMAQWGRLLMRATGGAAGLIERRAIITSLSGNVYCIRDQTSLIVKYFDICFELMF